MTRAGKAVALAAAAGAVWLGVRLFERANAPLRPDPEIAASLRPIDPAAPGAAAPYAAAPPRLEWLALLRSADAARGEQVMRQGLGPRQVQACTSCHGVNGEPLAGSQVPRLSGQSAYYLVKQLFDYASGARRNPVMTAYARLMSPQQMADVALAWSRRQAPYKAPAPEGDAFVRGGSLFALGDPGRRVPACQNCHGAGRTGADQPFPYIGGQHPDYTRAALSDWTQGLRANDPGAVMRGVVAGLAPEDRQAIALYLATLAPPGSP